jgi:hypothetical protein
MRRYQVKSTSKNILFELLSCLALLVCVSNTLATHWQHNKGKGHVTNTVELHWASAHVEEEEEEEEEEELAVGNRSPHIYVCGVVYVCLWRSVRMCGVRDCTSSHTNTLHTYTKHIH